MNPHHQTKILLADDDPRVCWSLHMLLRHRPGLSIVGQEDQAGLLTKAAASRPHIILLDWELAAETPDRLISALHSLDTRPIVIVLSVQPEREHQALTAGADAFVTKIDPPERLLEAVDRFLSARS